jgi:carboxymethylenebutenolidase
MKRAHCVLLTLTLAMACRRSASHAANRETAHLPPGTEVVSFASGTLGLRGLLLTPKGTGPFPALLYNHGSAAGVASNFAFANIAPVFVARGWVFFMPYRRGQGLSASAGPYILNQVETARRKGGLEAGAAEQLRLLQTDHFDDQMAGLTWLRRAPFVQSSRIAVAGNSLGGIEAVLGAEHAAYCAAVDASGAAQSWSVSPKLQARLINAVRNAKAPLYFFQAENDFDLSPTRVLFATAQAAGKRAEMKIYPAFGTTANEGHSFPYSAVAVWADDVLAFMEEACAR